MRKAGSQDQAKEIGSTAPLGASCKPYLSIKELAALTPWTEQAIRSKIKNGEFVDGIHFFRGVRQVIFKWEAVIRFIEHQEPPAAGPIPLARAARRHEPAQA